MKIKKVIFIGYVPLTFKVYQDFYFDLIIQNNILVEYWNISSLFFKDEIEMEDSSYLVENRNFDSYSVLKTTIVNEQVNNSDVAYISLMTFSYKLLRLFQIFTICKCLVIGFGRNMVPIESINGNTFKKNIQLSNINLIRFLKKRNTYNKVITGKIKTYDAVFLAGFQGYKALGVPDIAIEKIKKIQINSSDYDVCMELVEQNSILNYNYILFLDEYLPFHPDNSLLGLDVISPESYYPLLNKYFDKIEYLFHKPVVIAAHPKALKYKQHNFFEGRKVLFNSTAQLSAHADFVIAHASTSVSFSVIFRKKLHFITSNSIEKFMQPVHLNILNFSKHLGSNCQYFDKNIDNINIVNDLPVDYYEKYKMNFLTSVHSEAKNTSDVFIDFLNNCSFV